jgi:hypothetical protein
MRCFYAGMETAGMVADTRNLILQKEQGMLYNESHFFETPSRIMMFFQTYHFLNP